MPPQSVGSLVAVWGVLLSGCTAPDPDEVDQGDRVALEDCPGNYRIDWWDTEGALALISSCDFIAGDLRINMTQLEDLDALGNLTEVGGYLHIGGIPGAEYEVSLLNIDGLGNLVSIGGKLVIETQNELTTLGMDSLTTVGGSVSIGFNTSLCTSLAEEFVGSLQVGGDITIQANRPDC